MSQWSLADRTLYAKLVYYGPALGGKTTNLRVLHDVTDPEGRGQLVSVNTADDRTLFFDLLPFDLGKVLGFKVALKLYTVPGQIQYNATRRAVLAGADAVVFVADSNAVREQDNRLAWANLEHNMRAARLDPGVPILVQCNKRDLAGAAPMAAMENWLAIAPGSAMSATACEGKGVLETLVAASHAMIDSIVSKAEPQTRRNLHLGDLKSQLDAAFAPHIARSISRVVPQIAREEAPPIVLPNSDLLESAVASSVALGAQLADEHSRASRLERESESFRRLSDALRSTGASFERDTVLEAALDATVATLGAAAAALCVLDAEGHVQIERSHGADFAPLLDDEDAETLLANMIGLGSLTVVDDLHVELPRAAAVAAAFRALAVVPVEAREHASLVVLMRAPDGAIESVDVRFLATLAGHLAVGLEKVRIHEELRTHRDRLEEEVSVRTASLRRVYDEIKSVDEMKDRFLANVSHEMLSPLTAIIGSASFLKDYRGERGDAEEMVSGILQSAHALERMVDGLLRVARVDTGDLAMVAAVTPADVIAEAVRLADADGRATIVIDPRIGTIPADPPRLARALGNLLDNALKFGPATESIELRVEPCWLGPEGDDRSGVSFAVLDGGPGLADGDEDRAFAPFEQGGDPLTGKPAGVGLGLYEARLIARRHGGTLEYAPRPEGGSEFRISLPAESAAARHAEQARGA